MNIKSLSPTPRDVGQWVADTKVVKIDSEFEKNAVGHMTFVGRLTMLAGLIMHV